MSRLNGIHRRVNGEGKLEIEFCRELWDTIKSFDIAVPKKCWFKEHNIIMGCNGIGKHKLITGGYDVDGSLRNNWFCSDCLSFAHRVDVMRDVERDLYSTYINNVKEEAIKKGKTEKAIKTAITKASKPYNEKFLGKIYLWTDIKIRKQVLKMWKDRGVALRISYPQGVASTKWMLNMQKTHHYIRNFKKVVIGDAVIKFKPKKIVS